MKKIAFITAHNHPQNDNTLKILKENFAEYEFEVIKIVNLIKQNKVVYFTNILMTFFEFGFEIIKGNQKFRKIFFRTAYIFREVKKLVNEKLQKGNFEFSFQIGSVFDTSLKGLPHFLYTDHTHLANLDYPAFSRSELLPEKIIRLEESIYKNASLNFTYSTNITNSIIRQYNCPQDQVACVYAGSNAKVEEIDPQIERYKNKNILFVGIDWERKGGPELVSAFSKILEKHPDAKLTIIGANPEISLLNCNVLGKIPVEQVNEYYKSASLFCMPTKREPFGLVFIEAMLYKLPVVATNIGAIPDFISNDENGYLVNSGDIESIAGSIINLFNDPEKCMRFGLEGYNRAIEKYTWEMVGKRMRDHIIKVLGNWKE